MALLVGWPTDGGDGSVSSEARWRKMARLWAPSGVVNGFSNELAPTLGAGVINVAAGAAWIDGHYCELESPASETNSANGLLVIRFTPADNTFELVYRDGATTPTQSDATWELPIAQMVAGALGDRRWFSPGAPAAGILAYAEVTTPQTGITSITDVAGLNIPATIPPNRRIKITGHVPVRVNGVAGTDRAIGGIWEGTVTELGRFVDFVPAANGARQIGHGAVIITPGAATRNYRLRIQRATGSGTVDVEGSAVNPAWLMVEDLGPV